MSNPKDPILLILELLEDNWDSSNTSSITPKFGVGWYETEASSTQVIVAQHPDEYSLGATGVDGLSGSGSPNQRIRGLIFVEVFVEEPVSDDGTAYIPEALAYVFVREIRRIIMANFNNVQADGYDYVTYSGMNRIVPSEDDHPISTRYSVRLGYQWRTG